MNDDRAFERATRDWLEAGSDRTPAERLDAVLLAVRTTPQERDLRIPWRTPTMSNPMRLVAAIAIIAVVGFAGLKLIGRGGTGSGGPSPSPIVTPTTNPTAAPTATPPPLPPTSWTSVTSARFGLTYKVPPGWATTPATAPWIWRVHDPGPKSTDLTVDSQRQGFSVASEKIPAGMTAAQWWADYLSVDTSSMPPGCFPATQSGYRMITVDGQAAYVHGEHAACNFSEAIVLVGGRVYQLDAQPNVDTVVGRVFDPALFAAWLSTVRFDPPSANDSPASSPAPS